jgi:hypothetical protein
MACLSAFPPTPLALLVAGASCGLIGGVVLTWGVRVRRRTAPARWRQDVRALVLTLLGRVRPGLSRHLPNWFHPDCGSSSSRASLAPLAGRRGKQRKALLPFHQRCRIHFFVLVSGFVDSSRRWCCLRSNTESAMRSDESSQEHRGATGQHALFATMAASSLLVNVLPSEQVWPSDVSTCPPR